MHGSAAITVYACGSDLIISRCPIKSPAISFPNNLNLIFLGGAASLISAIKGRAFRTLSQFKVARVTCFFAIFVDGAGVVGTELGLNPLKDSRNDLFDVSLTMSFRCLYSSNLLRVDESTRL